MDLDTVRTNFGQQPIAELSANSAAVLARLRETHHPLVLTQEGQSVAVLLDLDGFQTLLDELDLLRDVHRGLADVEAGRVVPHQEVRRLLRERYGPIC